MAGGGGLQATTLAHRVLRLLGRRRGPLVALPAPAPVPGWVGAPGAGADAGAAGVAGADVGATGVRAVRYDAGSAVGRAAPPGAAGDSGSSAGPADPVLLRVLDRARSSGAPEPAVRALAAAWPDLAPAERRAVDLPLGDGRPGPVRVGGAPARQTDGTTCGSAVLAMLAASGDPVLALWLATGRLLPGYLPPELRAMPGAQVTAPDAGARVTALQRVLKRASTRGALGPLPWPAALGTPPWGAARTARFPGVAWGHVLVDDTDADLVDAVLDRADAALAAGVPVPLFTGGDLGSGLAAAVPRHVVLLVPVVPTARADVARPDIPDAGPDGPGRDVACYAVYEPGAGRIHRIDRDRLARPGGPHAALGGWSHVCWAVLPHPAQSAAA